MSLSVEERRKKKEENVLLLLLLLLLWGSALTECQSGHFAHTPAPDGLVEGSGVEECCMG